MYTATFAVGLLSALSVLAAPSEVIRRQGGITTLSATEIAAFLPFTNFASAAYCEPSKIRNWSCGAYCDANPGFIPIAAGGDGAVVQYWFVGYDPSHATIVVVHQGTDISKLIPLLTDADLVPTPLDPTLFPGAPSDLLAHNGFSNEQALSSSDVFAAVQTGLSRYNLKSITLVGHSLGSGIALLDAVSLKARIPDASVQFYGYGLPRVGNQAFANYVDASLSSFTRITNLNDPTPTIPSEFLGFHHPSGEAHIDNDPELSWKHCPGQDNPDVQCSIGDTPSLIGSDYALHYGPYDGVMMGQC